MFPSFSPASPPLSILSLPVLTASKRGYRLLPLAALLLLLGACAGTIDSATTRPVKPAAKTPPKSTAATAPAAMKVGLLLPLSGPRAGLGQAMQNAAQMAVFDDNGAHIELLPRDTGETPQQAAAALQDLQAKGVSLVVGPLFAQQVAAVKPLAAAHSLPLLALSNDIGQAAPGTYLLGFNPAQQVARVTDFACVQGSKRFVALLPAGAYGDVINGALQTAVHRCSGAALVMRRYDPGTDQLARQLQETAATRQQIDTLFLAEAVPVLQNLAYPTALDGRHVRLLGTSQWNDDSAGRLSALSGAWFAVPDGGDRPRFVRNYQSFYGAAPPHLASLAYDAVALAAALQKRGLPPNSVNLTNPVGYMGVDGLFRLLPDGTVERGQSVSRVAVSGREILDRAPPDFGAAAH